MIKLVALCFPVVIFPLIAVQAIKSVLTHSVLPDVAASMQEAVDDDASDLARAASAGAVEMEGESLPVRLPLTLRF